MIDARIFGRDADVLLHYLSLSTWSLPRCERLVEVPTTAAASVAVARRQAQRPCNESSSHVSWTETNVWTISESRPRTNRRELTPLFLSHPISLGDPPTIRPHCFVCGGPRGRSRPQSEWGRIGRTDHSPTSATGGTMYTNPRGQHGDGKAISKSTNLSYS